MLRLMTVSRPIGRGRLTPLTLGLATLLAGTGIGHAGVTRAEFDLSGSWQYQKVAQLSYPPTNTWQIMAVPGFLSGWQYEHAWFRTLFPLPASVSGTTLRLRFGGVKYNAQVWLNGTYVGAYLNGYEPFEMDITGSALAGQTNELLVGVTDWTATFAAPVDFSDLAPYEDPRNHVQNDILAPIGGRYELYGIWQPVKVVSLPSAAVADVFVMPSVRAQQLTARLTLRNDSASPQTVTLTNRVLDGTNLTLLLPDQQLVLSANTTTQLDITASWPNPHLWSHVDPYLYCLESTLVSASGQDQVRTRFGFREFWATNGAFYLNGTPIHLLASATWPPSDLLSTNQIRQTLLDVKAGNNVALRLHTQPWDEPWYNLADEVGLLLVEECAVWCDPAAYKLSDFNFWTNYSQHLTSAVKRDRNHPAIVLWSLENEILHCGGEKLYSATDSQLAAMGRVVKAIDPTRPITYEADLDPGGQADALGLHYPHEFPDFQVWPNAAWWMNQPIPRDWVPGGQWLWDHSKPLYIGEFLWVPATSAGNFTILFGDDAYFDPPFYRNQAKGLTWRMQIEAYRAYGVNGICPWTMFEDPAVIWGQFDLHPDSNFLYQVQKAAYHPNAVVIEEYNPRFFSGDTVTRTIHVYNDKPAANNFTLRWSAGGSNWQSRAVSLPPASQLRDTISFTAPALASPFPLQLELSDGSGILFTNSISYSSMARTTLTAPPGLKLGLYDPRGTTAPLLARFGLSFTMLTNLRSAPYSQFNLVLIGRDALTNEPLPEVGGATLQAQWQNYCLHGGWLLLLEQTTYPAFMPAGLGLADFDASFAFPNSRHPLTQDLTPNDLRYWAGDHRVVVKSLVLPSRGSFRSLATVGASNGLEYAAALEVPLGPGGLLCSQWLLTQRFDLEPLAGILLQRLLNYCASPPGHLALHPAALLAETNSAAAVQLAQLGLQAENFLGRATNVEPSVYPLLIVAGGSAAWQEATSQFAALTNYLQRGGCLFLHQPDPAFLALAKPALFPDLDYADTTLGLVLRRDPSNAVVRLANHDLFWIAQAGNWNQPEVLSTNVARRYYHKRFNLSSYSTIQVENMPIHTSGGPGTGGWWLWSNGYVAQNISVAQPGTYLFNILASGTPALGGWPQMSLRIDGTPLDSISVPTNVSAWYTLSADLAAGTHQLAISFDNDAYNPPEDRNLFLDQIQWGRDADNSPIALLSRPGAVAQVRSGNGLVLLDEIAWESETSNATKAGRYASSLLSGLGASLRLATALRLEAELMTNVNVSSYYTAGGIAYLNSNGRIQTNVSFASTGVYTFEFVAGGTAALGTNPQVALVIDGANRTNFLLSGTNATHYYIPLYVTAGIHAVGLAFLNDYYAPPADRNAWFDYLTITPASAPTIGGIFADPSRQRVTVQWETVPGKAYEVQTTTNLAPAAWRAITNLTSLGTIASWADTGQLTGTPPLSPAAPSRYYRIRLMPN
jgi:hypothetical protein